jgi:type IV pilus assembly protein PilC
MSIYTCKLGTSDGKVLSREFDTVDPAALRKNLEDQGYFVFDIRKKPLQLLFGRWIGRRGVTKRHLLLFNQELLVLIKSGMPIIQALDTILEHQDEGVLGDALKQLREDVKGGEALSTALERFRHIFPDIYIASIRAGERIGDLPNSIQRFIRYLKKVEEIRKKLVSAMFYPSILIVVSILAISLLLFYVVPILSQVFTDSGAQLPLLTRLLISFTTLLRHYALLGLVLLIIAAIAFRSWAVSPSGRYMIDRFKLRLPYAGEAVLEYCLAGFSRTLGNLLYNGIPIVESLRISVGTLTNVYMEKHFMEVVKDVEEGGRLSSAFGRTGIIKPFAVRMLSVGESTGSLEEMLMDISEYLEESLEEKLHLLTSAIEPAIMIVMGLVIGVIIIAMYLPIFKLAGTVG